MCQEEIIMELKAIIAIGLVLFIIGGLIFLKIRTTAPSMVLRCKRPSTPICCGVISTMEIITFTSTPTLPGF